MPNSMTPTEILSGLEEALREARAPGFKFRLVCSEKEWQGPCSQGPEVHRVRLPLEFGIWCRMCRTAYVPEQMHERATPFVLMEAALTMLGRRTL